MLKLNKANKPVLIWTDTYPDTQTLDQATNLANLPFIHAHIALMPDCHVGYGMPIGGVMAAEDVVVPNAVGEDIGCGMIAARSDMQEVSAEQLRELMTLIKRRIPVGFNSHTDAQDERFYPKYEFSYCGSSSGLKIVDRNFDKVGRQLGTLGGGNHFIEVQKDEEGFIWLMIHSGSRNLGLQVAKYYNDKAKQLNERWRINGPARHDLAFLPIAEDIAHQYMEEMNYCVGFAEANRNLMMIRAMESVVDVIGGFEFEPVIDVAHNYAAREHHMGRDVIVHRKGATKATDGMLGVIPGSQGTSSYIVQGKGNPASFCSCSHGAGRKLGRRKAKETLDLAAEKAAMDQLGVIHSMNSEKDLDEAPGAYKDIDQVMANQADLVDVIHRLTPIAVVKG